MKESSMNTKMLLGFLAGAVFVLGLLVTCGTNSQGGGGTRTASADGGGRTVWEYATYKSLSNAVEVPTAATAPSISSCQTHTCVLNIMGAEGWELVTINSSDNYFYFKRPK
jgi:hypothetical protein